MIKRNVRPLKFSSISIFRGYTLAGTSLISHLEALADAKFSSIFYLVFPEGEQTIETLKLFLEHN